MIHLDIKKAKKPVYLDHAATTPVDPRVVKKMLPFFSKKFGNASSLYRLGIESKTALEEARSKIGFELRASGSEILFTGGGTESINLALQGTARARGMKGRIIVSSIEHHAVLRCVEYLITQGIDVVEIPVDSEGNISLDALEKALTPETFLVSLMYANNEVGTIQPLSKFAKLIRAKEKTFGTHIYFHTDACQAPGFLPLDVRELDVDLLTLNASKMYGPKGVGILYVRRGVRIDPVVFGGNQERAMRSGTENIPGVVGMAEALSLVCKDQEKEVARLTKLRDDFMKKVSQLPGAKINGARKNRLANNVHVSFGGLKGEAIVIHLDEYNIQASTGSACTSTELEPSHVVLAMGKSEAEAEGSVRFTLGRETSKKDLEYTVKVLEQIVARLRSVELS